MPIDRNDAKFIWFLCGGDSLENPPEGLDPTFYTTLSAEGDREVAARVRKILGLERRSSKVELLCAEIKQKQSLNFSEKGDKADG